MALILDTGPLLAALDRSDAYHQVCRALLAGTSEPLIIPSPVLTELDYWLEKYGGATAQIALVDEIINGVYTVTDLEPDDYLRVREIMARYADAAVGFVDAAVLAIVERLREPKLATLDRRHFGILRLLHVDSLRLLPE
jgi:predicted nucleic acid-binding protein